MTIPVAPLGDAISRAGTSLARLERRVSHLESLEGSGGGGSGLSDFVGGRLTTETGVPVSESARTAQSTLYYTYYENNLLSLYDGATWNPYEFSEPSVAVPSTADTPFDVFGYLSDGSPALITQDWSSATARDLGISRSSGRYVLTGYPEYRYLGTGCTTSSSGQIEDSRQYRLLWNMYNRKIRPVGVTESTTNWTYGTNAWREARGQASNRIGIVVGLQEETLLLNIQVLFATNVSSTCRVGIGEDITNDTSVIVTNEGIQMASTTPGSSLALIAQGVWEPIPAIGYHFYQWVETSPLSSTVTFYSLLTTGTTDRQSGIIGEWPS